MGLRFAPEVQDFVRTLAPDPKKELKAVLRKLREDPRHPDVDVRVMRKDGATRFFRARVRTYRIVYTVRAGDVYVWRILHPSEGYDWFDRLDPDR